MRKLKNLTFLALLTLIGGGVVLAAPAEWNQVRQHPISIGPQADRLVVGFKASAANSSTKSIKLRSSRTVQIRQAQTSAEDAVNLAGRTGIAIATTRQLTPNMHVMFLPKTLYGLNVTQTLARLRADPAVAFAEVDERRYVHAVTTPNDPLFQPTASATGQWFMLTPSTLTATSDASATDAVSAWTITQGSSGTVIADVDSGFRFEHPDLGRAGIGAGRLLPGYDFVGQDYDTTSGAALGTYLTANDGDGWDPDPSDPGDWIDGTDQTNALFPASRCAAENSSWHGTRVAGVLGAITNNNAGIAGMTWNPYILPVRALGKCGGYDSDIMTAMQWAAGLSVSGVPDNPYPADIINLSLGGSGTCPADYQSVIDTLTSMGVLIVASAGNESGPVDIPGNCQGVLAVAGLRNVGTKVGYSSLGAEVGIAAPAGNCVNSGLPCLRSIDTTVNEGATTPTTNSYTDQTNYNLGTSFSAPIVSGVAALMRAVNNNLTPAQLIARIKASASPFPAPVGTPVCPATTPTGGGECACTTTQCGAGMINAFSAVKAALKPIAAIVLPAGLSAGSGSFTFNGGGSAAACNQTIASYAWTASGGVTISGAGNGATVNATWNAASGTLTLTVTDGAGNSDAATVIFASGSATTTAPSNAGTSATACPTPMTVTVQPPTIALAFAPTSVATSVDSVLTITLSNPNPFALTQAAIAQSLPSGLALDNTIAPTTSCAGASHSLTSTASSVSLSNANIPASASCSITISLKSTAAASYAVSDAAGALVTAPAGSSTLAASSTLTVTAPPAAGKSGGGGDMDIFDILLITGVLLVARGKLRRRI